MKITILIADSNGCFTVPAVKDGAVATLVQHLLDSNETRKWVDLTIVSYWSKEAEKEALKYKNCNFIWVKCPSIIKKMDDVFFGLVQYIFKNKKIVSYRSAFSLLYYILKTSNILKKNTFENIIIENNIPLIWTIRLSNYKGKYYYHLHNVPRINAMCTKEFKNCTGYLCVSKFVGNQIASEQNPIGPIEEKKIKILYNCIDSDLFRITGDFSESISLRQKYNVPKNNKVVIFVGRMSAEKGIDKVLEAMINMNRKDVTLLVVGSLMHNLDVNDEYQCMIHNQAKKLGENVIFTGYISQRELYRYYNMADVAVLPSVWEEPAGLTMVEALACGLSVITTNSGGIPEYVSNVAIVLENDSNLVLNIEAELKKLLENNVEDIKDKKRRSYYIKEKFNCDLYIVKFCEMIESYYKNGKV